MFSINKKTEAGFEKVILTNELTGNYAVILPDCCAMLHEFGVVEDDSSINVIESFQSFEEYKNSLAEKGFRGCKHSPFVCRMNNGKFSFGE